MSQWQRLGNDRCPHESCNSGTRIRVHRKFRRFLQLALKKLGLEIPEGLSLSYQCPWCNRVRTFEIRDIVIGPDTPLDEVE